jgi:hypothetical protein
MVAGLRGYSRTAAIGALVIAASGLGEARAQPAPPKEGLAAAPPGTEPAAKGGENSSQTEANKKTEKSEESSPQTEAKKALQSQSQVPRIRGGTLGVPPNDTSRGLQTMVDGKVSSGNTKDVDKTSLDFYSKLAGLGLTRTLEAEILVERYQEGLPQVTPAMSPVLPAMVLTTMTSVGFRVRWLFWSRNWTVVGIKSPGAHRTDESQEVEARETVTKLFEGNSGWSVLAGLRFLKRSTTDSAAKDFSGIAGEFSLLYSRQLARAVNQDCKDQAGADADKAAQEGKVSADSKKKEAQEKVTEADAKVARISGQLVDAATGPNAQEATKAEHPTWAERIEEFKQAVLAFATAQKNREAAQAQAEEADKTLAASKVGAKNCDAGSNYKIGLFASGSATHLNDDRQQIESATVLFPTFSEARFSAGLELQTAGVIREAPVLPRLGVYATVSRGFWTNAFAVAEQDADVRGVQWEAAAYVSGHFFSGFSTLVSFGVLKPYGHDEELQYVLSVAPAIGASIGGD